MCKPLRDSCPAGVGLTVMTGLFWVKHPYGNVENAYFETNMPGLCVNL